MQGIQVGHRLKPSSAVNLMWGQWERRGPGTPTQTGWDSGGTWRAWWFRVDPGVPLSKGQVGRSYGLTCCVLKQTTPQVTETLA